jgi:uncharacterized membrane protein/HD superfamily phosphodiesterase
MKELVIFFVIFSIAGWCIELVYRSVYNHKLVNPGLLYGPYLPIYGAGAVIIVSSYNYIRGFPLYIQILIFALLITILEYSAGLFTEIFYGIRLWNYEDERFNIKGRICLKYSLLWTGLSLILIKIIHPKLTEFLLLFPREPLFIAALSVLGIMAMDAVASTVPINRFKVKLEYIREFFHILTENELLNIFKGIRRYQNAFGLLREQIGISISSNIKENLSDHINAYVELFYKKLYEKKPMQNEFNSISQDILTNKEFLKLKRYHHHNSSIYEHAKKVAYVSYKLCKFLGLDYISAARGALLHDFFLYDWRRDYGRPYKGGLHGLRHPKVALYNSEKHFILNPIEKDIIIKHMWPLTLSPPVFKESFIVNFVDKYVSSKEFLGKIKLDVKNRVKMSDAA